jgi:GGDEF domain-containing protein
MTYKRFEQLVLILGGALIALSLGTALASGTPELPEIVAQLLLFGVLVAAVKYGRRGGLIAAIVASAIYLMMRVELVAEGPLTSTAFFIVFSRLLAFGLVGVAGGEACSRIRYSLATIEGGSALDDWSRVFNQKWAYKTLDQARGRFRRYGEPFSVVLITLSPAITANIKPSKQRAIVRSVADGIRADIRMVDEVARLDDGRFLVMLPHTPLDGGKIVADRLAGLTRKALGSRDEAIRVECLAVPANEPELDALINNIGEPSEAE